MMTKIISLFWVIAFLSISHAFPNISRLNNNTFHIDNNDNNNNNNNDNNYNVTKSPELNSLTNDDVKSNESYEDEHGVYVMRAAYLFGLTMFQIDAACIIYVIHRTYQRWKTSGYYLSMAYKIPFYMALIDFIIYFFQTVNLLHPLAATDNWSEPYCSFIAGGFFFWTIFNILLVGMSALMSWLIVCKKVQLNLGTCDYKMFIIPFIFATILCVISFPTFGSDEFWCYTSDQYTTVPAILLIVDISILSLSLCCYVNILNEIKTSELCNRNGHLIKAYRKILGYIVMYIVQWTPLMIYVIADVLNQEKLWLYFFTVSFISMGGILNMIQYILNEGWKDKHDPLYEISRRRISQSTKSHEIEGEIEGMNENDINNNNNLNSNLNNNIIIVTNNV
ncbi:hypothetical protein Glove_99g370 [Diversispora epigaea]|uniref:G-protein coupled receptors family 1 profile domain-containing protein n=1 Tax=Diversispora epigaea TaxID=1348612 RepID=A0A397J8G4_9GLOM|nr:hypothetical protein Glove_99g370 [Diversispora epigaea]